MKNLLIFLAFSFSIFGCSNKQPQGSSSLLDAKSFAEKISQTSNAQIIDVRTPEEYNKGHLQNSINANWNSSDFLKELSGIRKSKPVFVYCLAGSRSAAAVAKLKSEGYKEIYDMKGGFMAWNAAGLPNTTAVKVNMVSMSMKDYGNLIDSSKLVLVDFYADWCGPCKKMAPFLKKIATEKSQTLSLVKVNADDNKNLCFQLSVDALPTLKLYKNKMLVWENVGYIDENSLREVIEKEQ